jgi:glycosyltransferase involved in cell wall biosynthesis
MSREGATKVEGGGAAAAGEVSVVVPTMNEEGSVVGLLEALAGQTVRPAEVVVADGGSTDRTRELVREYARRAPFPVLLVETERGLPGRNRNAALARATREWGACIDAGTLPRPDWLERLLEAARREPEARVVFGGFEAVTDSFFTRAAAVTYVPAPGECIRSTASCLLHRAAWEQAGRFREDLRSAEDLLFFRQLKEAGVREAFAPGAVVAWELRPTLASTFRKFAAYARSNVRAGLAREWQYGVARFYLLLLATAAAGLFFRPLLALPAALLLMRAARRVWKWHAHLPAGRRALELLHLPRLLAVAFINFVIDVAMFRGTLQWFVHDRKEVDGRR